MFAQKGKNSKSHFFYEYGKILDFTNSIKKDSVDSKSIVIKELWKIIISNSKTDEYESNLMRRICGLIYFPDKLSGEIKLQLLNEIKN